MAKRLPSRTKILGLLDEEDRAWHLREIGAGLRVEPDDHDALERILDGMVLDGVIAPRPGNKYRAARAPESGRGPKRDEREGVLSVNPRGFGFVSSGDGDDVFVGEGGLHGAMHMDRVVVRVRSRGSRGAEGEVDRVIEHGMTRVPGILRRRGKSAWLEPDDLRVRGPIVLTATLDVQGPEGNSGVDGDAAIAIITRWPELPAENPEGRLEAVLGRPGELRVEIAKILAMAQIQELHSEEAVAEAQAYGDTVPEHMLAGREDLTHLPLPTIDPEDARDHDDAVWVERVEDGGYIAWVAIADVSSYVTPGTKLDAEAVGRGCSVYLPDRAIPMLPRALSSNLCSLLPDELRLCLCAEVKLDAGGRVRGSRLIRGFMRSRAKLTYGGVARALRLSEVPPVDPRAEELVEGLKVAYELSRVLRGRRSKRGALDFDLPEPRVVIENGAVVDVKRRSEDAGVKRAYQLIEELMLLGNEVVAEYLVERCVPTIFRVHGTPDEKKLEKLGHMCESLGLDFDVEATKEPKALQALLKTFAEHPLAMVLHMLLLRSMKQASYETTNIGHFGLASKAYVHFTSPIRRYPDLVVHRGVHGILLGKTTRDDDAAREKLQDAAAAASSAERRSMEVERSVVDLHRAVLMRERLGERYEGTVTGLVGSGVFVALDAPYVDVLVRLEDLGGDSYALDDEGLFVVAARSGDRVGLGDRMIVEVLEVSIPRRTVYGRRIGGEATREERRGRRRMEGRPGDGRPARRGDDAPRGRPKPGKPTKAKGGSKGLPKVLSKGPKKVKAAKGGKGAGGRKAKTKRRKG